jgi:hypothetical protein
MLSVNATTAERRAAAASSKKEAFCRAGPALVKLLLEYGKPGGFDARRDDTAAELAGAVRSAAVDLSSNTATETPESPTTSDPLREALRTIDLPAGTKATTRTNIISKLLHPLAASWLAAKIKRVEAFAATPLTHASINGSIVVAPDMVGIQPSSDARDLSKRPLTAVEGKLDPCIFGGYRMSKVLKDEVLPDLGGATAQDINRLDSQPDAVGKISIVLASQTKEWWISLRAAAAEGRGGHIIRRLFFKALGPVPNILTGAYMAPSKIVGSIAIGIKKVREVLIRTDRGKVTWVNPDALRDMRDYFLGHIDRDAPPPVHLKDSNGSFVSFTDAAFTAFDDTEAGRTERHRFFATVASRAKYAVVADLGAVRTSGWIVLDMSRFYAEGLVIIMGTFLGGSKKMRRAMMRTAKRQQETAEGDVEAQRRHRMQRIEGDRNFNQAILKGLREVLKKAGVTDNSDRVAPPVVIIGDSGRGTPGQQSGASSFFKFACSVLAVCKAAEHKTTAACCACGQETEQVPCVGQTYASRSRRCKVKLDAEGKPETNEAGEVKLCPLFGGTRRAYTVPGSDTVHEEKEINRAYHRDLAAGLGIFVHWACHALDIDLPEHYMNPSQLQAKKKRDTSATA